MLLELLWEKKHCITSDILQDRSDTASSFETGNCELPSINTRKPFTLSDVCSGMNHIKSKGVVRNDHMSSHGGCGPHVNSYVNPNYHLPPRDDLPFGTGEKRLCDGEVDFDLAVSNKRCLLQSPRVNDPFVLVAGDSQLRTFVSGRVSCPNEWAVLSVPGGHFSHVGDAIGQVVCRDFLGRENPNAIVLMCGTNDLVSVDSQSWKENFRRLLHRCQYLFPQVPTYAIAPRDDLRHLVPHITIAMGEVCAEFPSYVVLLDFSKEFPMSDTFLCALNDPVHLSDNCGLPRLQRMVSDVLAQWKLFAEEQQVRLERGLPVSPFLPEHIWQKIRCHAIFSAVPACRKPESHVVTRQPRVFNCDARHCNDTCPRHCKGGYVTLVSGELVSDPNYCQVDIGDDKFVYISAKWSRQRKLVQDKRKSSTVIGRNMNTFRKKKVVITPKVKVLPVKFPCVVKGCSHGYFKDDGKFLDHVIRDHSSIGEVSKAAPLSIQEPLQAESSPSELSPSFSSECIPVAPNIESPSFCCQNNFAFAVDVDNTCHSISLPDSGADPGRYNAFALTTVHNDCRPKSYLVTLSHYFLLVLSFTYIVYVLLLLLAGDIESNPGPSENKREASGEPTGEPPQNKKRKREKVDSEEEIDFTVWFSATHKKRS